MQTDIEMDSSSVRITITNDTTHVIRIISGNWGVNWTLCDALHPGQKYDLIVVRHGTYFQYWIQRLDRPGIRCILDRSSLLYDFERREICEYEEISICTAPDDSETLVGIKLRGPHIRKQDQKDYKAKKNEASASMRRVVSVNNKLELRLKKIKICHAQCKHLVQTFSKGIQELTEEYTKVFQVEDNIKILYNIRNLRTLINCLDSLENCVRYTEKFLLECAREWKFLALQISVPFHSPETTTRSKFDCLNDELSWNLDKIRLCLTGEEYGSRLIWKWCSIKCKFVLIKAGGSVDHEGDGGSRANMDSDRHNLRRHLEDGSIFAQDQPFTIFKLWTWFIFALIQSLIMFKLWTWFIFAQIQSLIMCKLWMWSIFALIQPLIMFKPWTWFLEDGSREAFGAILKQRLGTQNMCVPALSTFEIDHLHLKFKTEIAGGGFKRIYRGEWLGLEVAIAIINVRDLDSGRSLVEKEAGHLANLQHPNIVAFYGYEYTCNPKLPAFYTRSNESPPGAACYLVMELMEEDLSRTIEKRMKSIGPFSMSVALDIMLQIVEAMVYLHDRDIMHRDLKPMNCLVKARPAPRSSNRDVYYDVKLTDFGSAKENVISNNTANPGTTSWMAPEMFGTSCTERIPYTKFGDVYGFAMICYQVITLEETPKLPKCYPSYPSAKLIEAVRNGARPLFPPSLSCPEGLKKLITNCWAGMPDARPNFKEIRRRLWDLKRAVEVGEVGEVGEVECL